MKLSVAAVLLIVFMTLKLAGVIAWSWWWVLAPLWAPAAIGLVILLFGLLVVGMGAMFGAD